MTMSPRKYAGEPDFRYAGRTWPDRILTEAPIWCSTDLRDGNQALQVPMNTEQKLAFFDLLTGIGFKEIEVAFPSASETEYELVRRLIEENRIPEDVTIEVFTQARDHLIDRTFESVKDARRAIVHLYNSTCPLHREVVFGMDREEIKAIAVKGARRFKELAERYGPEKYFFEYSPETFNATEMDYVIELCNAVLDVWQPTPEHKAIINLPETVQLATPNVYADQIQYVSERLNYRDSVIVSVHVHNDRGTGVAATELALMAGAQRVEGTLFGNGERTGNVDLVTLALNLYTKGIDPGLDFSRLDEIAEACERLTGMGVPPRYPYSGELVFTAFSGSHQDAIKKGMDRLEQPYERWRMPYLIIDPKDIGRSYEAIIRVNSQSGKGGVFYLLNTHYGIEPPKALQQEFGDRCTRVSDRGNKELTPNELYRLFEEEYVNRGDQLRLAGYTESREEDGVRVEAEIEYGGARSLVEGRGNGPLDALRGALAGLLNNGSPGGEEPGASPLVFDIATYSQNATRVGSDAKAVSYIRIVDASGCGFWGAGMDTHIGQSSVKALLSAVNRMLAEVSVSAAESNR
ncbi:2-isopropylmalate synthase [Paenibacillus glufosinatiresistens]|uniref:2-isopropylmalate synthase n=1 Tax=Paenibacillus glufosinatiresistens TaxID=3070657 RepID=UPI00286E91E6|nr:2-isopropylmalate synthase [Paenibacillus sp. YX.27]